jgi:hypothetical protein
MKNGIIFYQKSFAIRNTLSKNEWQAKCKTWLTRTFPGVKEKIVADITGKVSGKGLLKIITDSVAGHYYWIRPAITISYTSDSCIIQSYNYYEKPVMPGVTNDYSKIEYRWWDFRKGKPWNKEDEALFEGLNAQTISMINSFETELNR